MLPIFQWTSRVSTPVVVSSCPPCFFLFYYSTIIIIILCKYNNNNNNISSSNDHHVQYHHHHHQDEQKNKQKHKDKDETKTSNDGSIFYNDRQVASSRLQEAQSEFQRFSSHDINHCSSFSSQSFLSFSSSPSAVAFLTLLSSILILSTSFLSWPASWPKVNLDRATSFQPDPLQVLLYFLGSGGTGSSGPLGDVGAVVAQNLRPEGVSVNVNSASPWLPNAHQQAPRRCDSTEADSPIRAEAIKLVRDLNRAVATHVALAALLGGSGDGPHLRDELRRARRTAQERAAALRATLWRALDAANTRPPSPQSNESARWVEKERTELERLWHLLLCCLDSLETSMQRSLILLREFSIADGSNILIHTGLDGVNNSARSYQTTSVEAGDVPLLDKLALEGAEASQLCKELFELRAQLLELKSAVEIRSLLSPPDCFAVEDISPMLKKPRRNDTLLSINGNEPPLSNAAGSSISCSIASDDKESIESDLESQATGITGAQRKCVCLILAIMVTVFVLAMFLGVLVALLS